MPWLTLADSHIGDRAEQQDRYLIVNSKDRNSQLLVVADGAGGHKTGALAAQTAIDCVSSNLELLWRSEDPEKFISQLIIECNRHVLQVGGDELACTTLVLVLIRGDEIFWGHAGDSRFYLIRDGKVVIRTVDHSKIELQRQQAENDGSKAINHSSNELYMCLGALTNIVPDVASSVAREGDALLLCSDGLWNQTDMEPIINALNDYPLTLNVLKNWIEKAKKAKSNSSDNISLVVAKYERKTPLLFIPFKVITKLFKPSHTQ